MSVFGPKKGKSDDLILEEAEDARRRERKGQVAPEDQMEHTYEETKDIAVKAKMEGATAERVAALEKQLVEMRQLMSDELKRIRPPSAAQYEKLKNEASDHKRGTPCGICGQYVVVCGGIPENHTTIRVLPERPEHYDNFPGVGINGVWYVGHAVVVPKACVDTILSKVKNWTEYRFNLARNRGRNVGNQGRKWVAESMGRGDLPII